MTTLEKIVFFDTETNGLPNDLNNFTNLFNTSKCRMIQFAYYLCDKNLNTIKSESIYITPDGFDVTNSNFHGITTSFLNENGIPITDALDIITDLLQDATIVNFNTKFDMFVLNGELHRYQRKPIITDNKLCLMTEMTDVIKKPSKSQRYSGYAWPKLIESAEFFNIQYDSSKLHDALYDVQLTYEVYKKLKGL